MKRLILTAMVALATLAFAAKAEAAIIIDFFNSGAGANGTVTDLGGGHWSGSGIFVPQMTASGTSADGTYAVQGPVNGSPGDGSFSFNTQTGAISLTGWVQGLGTQSNVTLLSGNITSFFTTPDPVHANVFNLTASGVDSKNPELLRALGVPPNTPFSFYSVTMIFRRLSNGTYASERMSIQNTANPIPEPGSMVLLGSGLLGLAAMARRRKRKA